MEGAVDGKEILESLSLVEGGTPAKTEESTGTKKVCTSRSIFVGWGVGVYI